MDYDLEERLINFAVRVIKSADSLPKTRTGRHVADQLVRSGTSPAPNYGEAQSAESRADFVHKIKICLKELRETKIWFKMIKVASLISSPERLDPIIQECDELIAIFVSSIKTVNRVSGKK